MTSGPRAGGAPGLTMREVCARTGLEPPTLRMWEQRHGFPEPARLPSGHRRYSELDVALIRQVCADREGGLSLPAAIERARGSREEAHSSLFAALCRMRPDLQPYTLPKRTLIALSHAIEDECTARAEEPLLFATFQRERFYRQAETRWRKLASSAETAVVFADFDRVRRPAGGPVEVPIDRSEPMGREWSLVCDARDYCACLSGWEVPGQEEVADRERGFRTIWSVEPGIVRDAARIASEMAEDEAPDIAEAVRDRLRETPYWSHDELRLATALSNRMVAYVGGADVSSLPEPHSSRAV